jgi:hypothetical protein
MSAPGTDSKKRRRPEPQYYPPGPRLFPEPGAPVWVPSDKGHIRLDKIVLARLTSANLSPVRAGLDDPSITFHENISILFCLVLC